MEMELKFKDPAIRRRRLIILLGVIMAITAGVVAFGMSRSGAAPAVAEATKRPVLVAAVDIPARTVLQNEHVTVRQIPDDPSLRLAYNKATDVVGQVTTGPITAGQAIYPNVLVTNAGGGAFSILGPNEVVSTDSPFWRAVSVQVPSDRAVAGQILTGQRVDLFATVQIDVLVRDADGNFVPATTTEGYQSGKSTKITFQDLEVLSASGESGMYVLKVDLHQAEEIYHIASVAPNTFSLALRPAADTRTTETADYGETNDRIIVQYLYPLPQILDLGPLMALPTPASSPAPGQEPEPEPEPSPSASPTP
jgi:Flp pilus assembly protein CpaB